MYSIEFSLCSLSLFLLLFLRVKVRRHRCLLFCAAGVCLLSLLYFYKVLHQEALLKRLSTYSSQLAGFSGFLWQDTLTTSLLSDTYKQKAVRPQTNHGKVNIRFAVRKKVDLPAQNQSSHALLRTLRNPGTRLGLSLLLVRFHQIFIFLSLVYLIYLEK